MADRRGRCGKRWVLAIILFPAIVEAGPVDYQREIRTILSDNCYQCHGPDGNQRQAGLRLDTLEGATSELESGKRAIVAGNADHSELIVRLRSDDPDLKMPPKDFTKQLSAAQIDLLERWIKEGAPWRIHWAYTSPTRPELPSADPARRARTPIDRFILDRLAREGMTLAAEADRESLLRRVTLDLTGLPPTAEEIDTFLADTSGQAYERVVDRLLESPRYGEHMARYWLDAARYGDTHGLHLDNYRSMWPYRDWVIRAFASNLPFDRFAIEQLAGDLLPDATVESRVASGFNRCNVTTSEGGSIDEEFYVRYTVDRVETTAMVFMGLTLGCAACHDHKYDPFTQREFYQLFAYFNNLTEKPMDGNALDPPPTIRVMSPDDQAKLSDVDARLTTLREELRGPLPEVDAAQSAWESEWSGRLATLWQPIELTELRSTGGSTLERQRDGSILATGANPAKDVYEVVGAAPREEISAIRLECLTHESLVDGGPGRSSNSNFVLTGFELEAVSMADPSKVERVSFVSASADFHQQNGDYRIEKAIDQDADGKTGWAIAGFERHENRTAIFVPERPIGFPGGTLLRFRLRHESEFGQHAIGRFRLSATTDASLAPSRFSDWHVVGPLTAESGDQALATDFGPETAVDLNQKLGDGSLKWVRRRDLVDGKTHELRGENAATYLYRTIETPSSRQIHFGVGSDDAVKMWVDGKVVLEQPGQRSVAVDQNVVTLNLAAGTHHILMKVVNYSGGYAWTFRMIGEDAGREILEVAALLSSPAEGRSPAQGEKVREYYRSRHSPAWQARDAQRVQLEEERKSIEGRLPPTLVMQEMDGLREAYLLFRGEYDKRGDKVERRLPTILPPMPEGAPNNRLGLAQWLVSPNHPLTARVTVNRFWQQFFGTGLVKTSEDFGVQGDFPSHPELLDWLATEFIANGWDVKRLVKTMVLSSVYRQSSAVTPEGWAKDPENRLLARGARYRLDAEVIRDSALAISGLLVERVGGPSVKPYQPPGIWEAVAYPTSNTANFVRDTGESLYRRSLYTFWKRTAHAPSMQTFDAPSREQCTVRRARTNTPLQALVLMNDEQFVEASRSLGQRMMREGGVRDDDRLRQAFRWATTRQPDEVELAELRAMLARERARYASQVQEATKLIRVGESLPDPSIDPAELAAWTMIGNLLLNLHDTMTKG